MQLTSTGLRVARCHTHDQPPSVQLGARSVTGLQFRGGEQLRFTVPVEPTVAPDPLATEALQCQFYVPREPNRSRCVTPRGGLYHSCGMRSSAPRDHGREERARPAPVVNFALQTKPRVLSARTRTSADDSSLGPWRSKPHPHTLFLARAPPKPPPVIEDIPSLPGSSSVLVASVGLPRRRGSGAAIAPT